MKKCVVKFPCVPYFVEFCSFSAFNCFWFSIKFFVRSLLIWCLVGYQYFFFGKSISHFIRVFWADSWNVLSIWVVVFCFALKVLFLPFISFTVCQTNSDCLSFTEFLILLICFWMYSTCLFWYVFVSSLWAFLNFCPLVFIVFLLLYNDAFSCYLIFPKLLLTPMELYI